MLAAKSKMPVGFGVRNPNFRKEESSESENERSAADSDSGLSEDISNNKLKATKKRKSKLKNGNSAKKLKSKEQSLTVEEINNLKETEDLYHSNIFRMQIDETLKEVSLKETQKDFINKWLAAFKKFLKKLPDEDISGLLTHKDYPLKMKVIDPAKKIEVSYNPPQDVVLFGSHAVETNIETKSMVDVLICLPDEMFHKSDYLNHFYNHKRTIYLFYVAKKLQEKGTLGGNIQFKSMKHDPSKMSLMIDAEDFKISINAGPNENFFKLNRFIPKTNNIKLKNEGESTLPTPHYNFSVLYDCTVLKNQQFIENEVKNHENVKNAIKLLKIWLHQRQFDKGFYPLNGFIVTCYIIHLIKIRKIYPTMSCYQIVRLFWNHFGNSKLDHTGISLCQRNDLPNQPSLEDFHEFYDVVLVDESGYCNILSYLSVDLYRRVKIECLSAIKLLNDKSINSFQLLFLNNIPYYLQYDQIVAIKCDQKGLESISDRYGDEHDKINYYNTPYPLVRKLMMNVMRKGLGDRIISTVPILCDKNDELCIGLILNPENGFNVVDKGPQSNQPEAESFRAFWGKKAEIRRFKDGSITESLLWCPASAPFGEKRLICKQIVQFLLKQHFKIANEKVNYIANQFEITIRNIFNELIETNEERSLQAIRTFDELSRQLRGLNDIPLEIVSVLGIDAVFRYTDVTPPLANASATKNGYINKELKGKFLAQKVLNGVIQLASSGKWPDDIDAMKRIKAAFYIAIAGKIQSQYPEMEVQTLPDHIEILKDKILFRFKIVHPKEIALAKEEISSANNLTKVYKTNASSMRIEYESTLLPKLTSYLHGLHHKYPSYGPTVAIAKRWLYSQLIDPFLWPDECTELIIAEMFLKSNPAEPSMQPQVNFIRFLNYLANFSHENDMVVVNFNDDMDEEALSQLESKFRKCRKNFPPLFIVTSFDAPHQYGIWSSASPIINILNRVQVLAQFSIKMIGENFTKLSGATVKDLFTPSLEGYDMIITLNEKFVRKFDIVLHNFTNFKALQYEKKPAPPADIDLAARFLHELREAFDDVAVFFCDPICARKIAVLWKPCVQETRQFAVSQLSKCKLVNDRLVVNIDAILNDIQIIGRGLIENVEIMN